MGGIFDEGSSNCGSGKWFNDMLSIGTLGLVSGPTDKECTKWKWDAAMEAVKKIPVANIDMFYKIDKGGINFIEVKKTGEIDVFNKNTKTHTLLYDPNNQKKFGSQVQTQEEKHGLRNFASNAIKNYSNNEVKQSHNFNINSFLSKNGIIIVIVIIFLLYIIKK
jgi:hypothetical protein